MDDKKLKQVIKEAFVTQFNLFDEPTVSKVRKSRKKMSDAEKEQRRAERELQKKIEAEKKSDAEWAKRGVVQAQLFPEEYQRKTIDQIIDEAVEKVLSEDGIEIKPENKGKFTQTKERTGKSTSELLNSPNKKTRARANFARMVKRGWKPLKK